MKIIFDLSDFKYSINLFRQKVSCLKYMLNKFLNFLFIVSYYPREHRHVICPESKINCFGGIGQCAKNEVLMTIFKDTDSDATSFDWDSKVNIIFNKGCGCQMLADYSFLGDGN